MYDLKELYRLLRERDSCSSITLENGRLTLTLPHGEVQISEQRVQMLIHGKMYDSFGCEEEDNLENVADAVVLFAAELEYMGRNGNETYQKSERAAARSCGFIPLFAHLTLWVCLAMLVRMEDIRWLLGVFSIPVLAFALAALLRWRTYHRHWRCPRCEQPLPVSIRKLLTQMEYTTQCPHCGYGLEKIAPIEPAPEDGAAVRMDPDPAPPQPGSPLPTRICGWVSIAFVVLMAPLLTLGREPGSTDGVTAGVTVLALCLSVNLPLLLCRAPGLPDFVRPLVVVRESKLISRIGVFFWLAGMAMFFGAAAVTSVTPLESEMVVIITAMGLLALFSGVWMILARRNRTLYIWMDGALTYISYISSWGRVRRFEANQVHSTRLTVNQALHLLDARGKKLASVELNMAGADRLLDWLERWDLLPQMTPAMQKRAENEGNLPPEAVVWREEYRTRWHSHLKAIRVGLWLTLLLMGVGGILPGVLCLNGIINFKDMVLLHTIAPLPFFVLCFVFSSALLLGDRPKGATAEWNAMHIKVPFVLPFLFALVYFSQYYYLWAHWVLQVAGDGAHFVQALVLASALTILFAVVTDRKSVV